MDLRAMFAQSVQEDCLLVPHIRTPCTPDRFFILFIIARRRAELVQYAQLPQRLEERRKFIVVLV